MNILKRHWLIAGLVVVAVLVFAAFQFKGSDQPKYFTTKVDHGEIRQGDSEHVAGVAASVRQ